MNLLPAGAAGVHEQSEPQRRKCLKWIPESVNSLRLVFVAPFSFSCFFWARNCASNHEHLINYQFANKRNGKLGRVKG
jgi:hypothetical protein